MITSSAGSLNDICEVSDSGSGFHTIAVDDCEQFAQLLGRNGFRDYPEYVFRGHRDPSWPLLPSLYREFTNRGLKRFTTKEQELALREEAGQQTARALRHFLYGLRGSPWHEPCHDLLINWFEGRADPHPHIKDLRQAGVEQIEVWAALINTWAMGQHHGLWTPLLDWTESLLAAFYFAFEHADDRAEGDENRAVYALNRRLVSQRCASKDFQSPLDFVTPFSKNNPRMIAQRGLFTYSHTYQSVEEWVAEAFDGENLPVLIRILIRNVPTQHAIRWLNRAGISDRTLFPDLEGISAFSNRTLEDERLDNS